MNDIQHKAITEVLNPYPTATLLTLLEGFIAVLDHAEHDSLPNSNYGICCNLEHILGEWTYNSIIPVTMDIFNEYAEYAEDSHERSASYPMKGGCEVYIHESNLGLVWKNDGYKERIDFLYAIIEILTTLTGAQP